MFDYFRKFLSNAHQVCCEDSPNLGLHNLFSVRCPCSSLKVTTASLTWQLSNLNYNSHTISDSMASILGMKVDMYAWHIYIYIYMVMLVSMTLTLMQGHSGSAKPKCQCWMLSATIASNKHYTYLQRQSFFPPFFPPRFYVASTLQMFIWLDQLVSSFFFPCFFFCRSGYECSQCHCCQRRLAGETSVVSLLGGEGQVRVGKIGSPRHCCRR